MTRSTDPRLIAAAVLLLVSLTMGLVFHGTSVNLAVLALVVAALLGALVCTGTSGVLAMADTNRYGLVVSLAMLGYLVVAYRLSISPDSSFASSWVLAAGPIAFICGSRVVSNDAPRRVLAGGAAVLVVALATLSSVRFILLGERAHQPLVDPNNYATLMYLVWIPLVHRHLSEGWRGGHTSRLRHGLFLGSTFVLVLSIIATHSRTSLTIVGVAFVVWLSVVAVRRVAPRRLLAHAAVAALAWGVAVAVTLMTDAALKALEFGGGISIRGELIRSALAMFAQHLQGVGIFCFSLLYPSFRSPLEQDTAGLFVHNDYIQFLVEGGVPLLILLLMFVAAVFRRAFLLYRVAPSEERFAGLGVALALAAVSAHAAVSFVFYSLPLGILVGLLAAILFARPAMPGKELKRDAGVARAAVGAGIAAGWIMWLYLALDVATVGVFQDQFSFGLANSIRGDDRRMLEFSRFAQRVNANRGIPALGEAILLYRAARAEPDSRYLREQTYAQLHRAIEADPWNTLTYVRLAQFLDEFPPSGGRAPGESDEELLLSAIGLDRLFVPALDQLLQHYAETHQEPKSYALLRNVVYPWMATLRRNDVDASNRYFDYLEAYAGATGDTAFLTELKDRRSEVVNLAPREQEYWFF